MHNFYRKDHYKEAHPDVTDVFQCSICGERFDNVRKMSNHKRKHITQEFKCEFCQKIFHVSYEKRNKCPQ